MNDINIEELRTWLHELGHSEYRNAAEAMGVPYQSLCNFIYGRVDVPHWKNLQPMLKYQQERKAA